MSKMDNLRAMREARYAESAARAAGAGVARRPSLPRPAVAPEAPRTVEADADDLCGHKNMSGRTCTRDKGHAAKSHRYS